MTSAGRLPVIRAAAALKQITRPASSAMTRPSGRSSGLRPSCAQPADTAPAVSAAVPDMLTFIPVTPYRPRPSPY